MGITDDRNDPRLGHGADDAPGPQNEVYLVLSESLRSKGHVRPVMDSYVHLKCGAVTRMGLAIAETYARQPGFYGSTYCVGCAMHLPVDQFEWCSSAHATWESGGLMEASDQSVTANRLKVGS